MAPWTQEEIDAWKKRLVASQGLVDSVQDYACPQQESYNSPRKNTNQYGRNYGKQTTPKSSSAQTSRSKGIHGAVSSPGL